MIRTLAIFAMATVNLSSAPAALAQGVLPKHCIFQPGTPKPYHLGLPSQRIFVIGVALGPNVSTATPAARTDWSGKVQPLYGQSFSNINNAMFMQVSCQNSGTPAKPKTLCKVKAQPCHHL